MGLMIWNIFGGKRNTEDQRTKNRDGRGTLGHMESFRTCCKTWIFEFITAENFGHTLLPLHIK